MRSPASADVGVGDKHESLAIEGSAGIVAIRGVVHQDLY